MDETACYRLLLSALHPRGLQCPEGLDLRNFLRPFRGVSKWCLDLYVGFYQGLHNFRRDFLGFLQRLFDAFTPNGP